MAYYPDLSPFEYYRGEEHMLNVGWLSREQPFRRGPVPPAFAHELCLLAQHPVNTARGAHVCEFCEPPRDLIAVCSNYEQVWEMFRSGNGEIHVRSSSGTVYCAPALVLHYVGEHQYQPPKEFVDAVLHHRELRCQQRG
jgi:hypothetical protein